MSKPKAMCAALGVLPSNIWDKVAKPLLEAEDFVPQRALGIIRKGVLTDQELAVLVTAGVEYLFIQSQAPLNKQGKQ